MRQIICERSPFQALPSGSSYSGFPGPFGGAGPASQATTAWMVDGTFRNFHIELDAAPGSGKSWTFEIYKNGVATGVTVTIADTATTGEDVTNSFATSAGDWLACLITPTNSPNTVGGLAYSVEFESTNAGESGYGWRNAAFGDSTVARKNGVFWCNNQSSSLDTWNNTNTADEIANIVPTPGSITGTAMRVSVSPGGGSKAFESVIYKALAATPTTFVKQDGSGGTVDTRCTCSGTTQAITATFDLPVAAGDRVYYEITPLNSPAAFPDISLGTRFEATTDGESIMGGWLKSGSSNAAVRFFAPHGLHDTNSATEGDWELHANPTPFAIGRFYGRYSVAPGTASSGKKWDVVIRKNAVTPSSPLALSFLETTRATQDLVHSYNLNPGDTWEMMVTPTATPDVPTTFTWALVQTAVAAQIRASFVAGENTTFTASRVFAVGLDGNTNIADREGYAEFFANVAIRNGFLEIREITAPSGLANAAIIYVEDNGSGKTRLMVQFGSGAAQQIAIEP